LAEPQGRAPCRPRRKHRLPRAPVRGVDEEVAQVHRRDRARARGVQQLAHLAVRGEHLAALSDEKRSDDTAVLEHRPPAGLVGKLGTSLSLAHRVSKSRGSPSARAKPMHANTTKYGAA